MAVPLSADRMLAALRAEGVRVVEHPGWRTHNRAGHGAFGPMNGVLVHHTAGAGPGDGQIVWEGRADLPGPCAHAYLDKRGTVLLTGNGRANHAGGGDGAVLRAVIAESYGDRPPAPHQHEGSAGAVDGNARFYGLEMSNLGDGSDPWPAVQYDQAVRWAAGICRAHGWTEKSCIGHKEWSDWKPDPRGIDMVTFRADVAARLTHPANWNPSTEEDPMAGMTKADIYKAVWESDAMTPPTGAETKDNPKWWPQSVLRDIADRVRAVQRMEAAQTAAITALAGLVGKQVDTAQVVAAVQRAIADAVVQVDVAVTGTGTKES